MEDIIIREMNKNEIDVVRKLVLDTFIEFEAPDYSEEGIQSFKDFIFDDEKFLNLKINVIEIDDKIVSMIAIRNRTHIALLFTNKDFHKKGLARKLFNDFKSSLKDGDKITVNSSPYAVEVYKKLGFEIVEPEQTVDGIRFTKMMMEI